MLMAADQRKKRMSGNSLGGYGSRELRRTKKRSLASLQLGSTMEPHISLELDSSQMRVVAKKEQIGLSRRDMAPYFDFVSYQHKYLADVITLPEEIFSLENLKCIFSFEAWREYLSEDERIALSQFLPRGVDTEEVVQSLFEGGNFSFGNPVCSWGNMLASGNLHPDAVIQRDRSLLANQKAYCSKLQDYHSRMLRNLLQLKEMWNGCQEPLEFVPNINRPNNPTINRTFVDADEYRLQNPVQDPGESSESVSTMEYDQACNSEDYAVTAARSGELPNMRVRKLDNTKTPLLSSSYNLKDVVKHKKSENISSYNDLDDSAKYMACIRISKKQFELLKSLKQPGKGIQSKSVKHVLGSLSSYCVQPLSKFEEEQQMKLHKQWLIVINTVARASAEWRVRRTHKEQITQLLSQDLKDNAKQVLQDEDCSGCKQINVECRGRTDSISNMDDCEDHIDALAEVQDTMRYNKVGEGFEANDVGSADNDGSQTTEVIPSSHEDSMLEIALENDVPANGLHTSYELYPPDYPCVSNSSFGTQSGLGGFWQTAKPSLPSHQSTLGGGYTDVASKLPYQGLQSKLDCHPQFLNSETDLLETGTEAGVPYSLSNQQTYSAYQNEDRSGMLMQSIFSTPELSSYKPHQKQATPHVQQIIPNTRLHVQYQEPLLQVHPLETGLKIDEQFYMNYQSSNNMHDLSQSDVASSFPVQGQLAPFHLQDWHANSIGMPPLPLLTQSHAGNFSTENWNSPSQQIHGVWSCAPNDFSVLSQSVRHETSNNDESLFSVLSQCKNLRSNYNQHMGTSGQEMARGAFGVTGRNGIPQITHPLVAPSLSQNSVGWVNIPQQTSSLPDPLGKPFIRSWNQ